VPARMARGAQNDTAPLKAGPLATVSAVLRR
jgi:hypothetical protein